MSTHADTITGLNIGASSVTALLAERREDGAWQVVGLGRTHSGGLRRGVIVDLERMTAAVGRALADAEMMAGAPIGSLHANIGGEHIRSVNSRGVVAVGRKGAITEDDVERVLQAARAVPVPPDREVVHVLPQEFIVDDQGGIKNPLGMSGARLEVAVHIVTASALAVGNITHCVRQAGYSLDALSLSGLASAAATLTEREQESGVVLVDIGAASTGIVVVVDGAICHTSTAPVGGHFVTNDLAIGLRTSLESAERIKSAGVLSDDAPSDWDESVDVPGGDQPTRTISRRVVAAIIGPRIEEILQLAKSEIQKAPTSDQLASGVVLTGGGAMVDGIVPVAERIFNLPVRIGRPSGLAGLSDLVGSPADATAAGLVLLAARSMRRTPTPRGVFRRMAGRIANALSGLA